MTLQPRRYRLPNGCVDVMPKPWYIDVLTAGIVFAWMGWTFTAIQQHGPSLNLLIPAVIIGALGVLFIYGQRLTYFRFGQLEVGMDSPLTNGPDGADDGGENEQDRYR